MEICTESGKWGESTEVNGADISHLTKPWGPHGAFVTSAWAHGYRKRHGDRHKAGALICSTGGLCTRGMSVEVCVGAEFCSACYKWHLKIWRHYLHFSSVEYCGLSVEIDPENILNWWLVNYMTLTNQYIALFLTSVKEYELNSFTSKHFLLLLFWGKQEEGNLQSWGTVLTSSLRVLRSPPKITEEGRILC